MRTKDVLASVATVALLGLIALVIRHEFFASSYVVPEGDVTFSDTGYYTRPRYHVQFPKIRLDQAGEFEFTCRGLPSDPLTLILKVCGKQDHDKLRTLSTFVTCTVVEVESATAVAMAIGPLSRWVLKWAWPLNGGGYYQHQIFFRKFNPYRTYHLKISVSDVDKNSPLLEVYPTLEGGGNERGVPWLP